MCIVINTKPSDLHQYFPYCSYDHLKEVVLQTTDISAKFKVRSALKHLFYKIKCRVEIRHQIDAFLRFIYTANVLHYFLVGLNTHAYSKIKITLKGQMLISKTNPCFYVSAVQIL